MNVTADTNVLVRAVVLDDPTQANLAKQVLGEASIIAVPLSSLCELVWVLRETYKFTPEVILVALVELVAVGKVRVDQPAVEAGLLFLRAGGDFADGVIAHEGRKLGGSTFVSFDKRASRIVKAQGFETRTLG